jgi:hypothetical protein
MTKANQYAGQSSMFNSLANLSMMIAPNKTSTGGGGKTAPNAISTEQFISNVNAGGWK